MIQEFLKTVPLFRDLDDDELAHVLMVGMVKRYSAGATILTEGTSGGQLLVIHEGQVRISKMIPGAGEEALAILGPGDFFGEVEFLDGSGVSANAIAHSDCETLAIPHREVEDLMRARPALCAKFLWAFARTLATRLRDTDQRMANLLALSRAF